MVEKYKVLGKQTNAAKQAWIAKCDECRRTEALLPPLMDDITRLTKDLEAYTKAQAGKNAMAPQGETEGDKPPQNEASLKRPGSPRSSGTKRPPTEANTGGATQNGLDAGFAKITLLLKQAAEQEAASSQQNPDSKPDFSRIPWTAIGLTNGGPLTQLISQTYFDAYTAAKQAAIPAPTTPISNWVPPYGSQQAIPQPYPANRVDPSTTGLRIPPGEDASQEYQQTSPRSDFSDMADATVGERLWNGLTSAQWHEAQWNANQQEEQWNAEAAREQWYEENGSEEAMADTELPREVALQEELQHLRANISQAFHEQSAPIEVPT